MRYTLKDYQDDAVGDTLRELAESDRYSFRKIGFRDFKLDRRGRISTYISNSQL